MKKHLAIFSKDATEAILNGKKTIEERFSKRKIPPFGVVEVGDHVYMKPIRQEIIARFTVKKVIYFEGIDEDNWNLLKQSYFDNLGLKYQNFDQNYLDMHKDAKYGSLIFIDRVEKFITSPLKINKKDLRGWVIL